MDADSFFLLVLTCATLWVVSKIRMVKASETWPVCAGTIGSSEVMVDADWEYGNSTWAEVGYRYQVDAVEYSGKRVSYGYCGRPAEVVKRYPAGSSAVVHYNPVRPADAVLETGSRTLLYV